MVPEPADTGRCLAHGVVAQASLVQRRARQDRSRSVTLSDQDRRRRVTVIFGEEAIARRGGHS
eukprot:795235-Alexandrium_andersonii.AAC.1